MERYDAILEQLKKAQSRGMETITNRFDLVVQSLEELIQEAKSAVQETVPESADDAFPIEDLRAALDSYRDEAEAANLRASELEEALAEQEQADHVAQPGMSIDLMRALDGSRSQSELLKELLPAISDHAARAVVLVLRDGRVSAWSGIGFPDGEALRSWQGEAAESAALVKLLEVSKPVRFTPAEDDLFRGWLMNEDGPIEILLIPVVLRGKLMGTVYIDHLQGHPWMPETAQTLVAQVCWLIDTLQYRAEAAPTLAIPVTIESAGEVAEPEEPQTEVEPQVEEVETSETEPESVDEDTTDEIEVEPEAQEDEPTTETEPVAEEEDEPDHEAVEIDPSATMRVDVSGLDDFDSAPVDQEEEIPEAEPETQFEAEPAGETFEPETSVEAEPETEIASESFEPEEPTEPDFDTPPEAEFEPETHDETPEEDAAEQPMEAASAEPEPAAAPPPVQMPVVPPEPEEEEQAEVSPSKFLDEPPPVQPVRPPPDEPEEEISEDEAQREEARRFARLLVSEIKLYNEEQVERGRESSDIYKRLKEDIDRSREMFDKRISAEVRTSQDYFTDELVRILADGNPDLLGM